MTSDDDPIGHQADRPLVRGPDGKFRSSTAVADRDAQAARLWSNGMSSRQIARELGFSSHSGAQAAVERGLAAARRPDAEALEAAKLRLAETRQTAAEMEAAAREVMGGRYLAVNQKGVVRHPETDELLLDSAPKLAAIDRVLAARKLVLAADEREAKLLGLDAEEKIAVSGGVIYEIVGVDPDAIVGP